MKTQSLLWKTTANIVDMNGKNKVPAHIVEQGEHIVWDVVTISPRNLSHKGENNVVAYEGILLASLSNSNYLLQN